MTQAPSSGFGPRTTRWNTLWRKWTPRIVLWTLASVIGLWLGTSARPATPLGHSAQRSTQSQASIADVFRWDILLTGEESKAGAAHPAASQPRKFSLPEAVLLARAQRPEPVPSVFPKTLSNTHRRFIFSMPARPAVPLRMNWERMKWDEQVDRLEHGQEGLRALLATVPGLTPVDQKSIQAEVDNACAQIRLHRIEQARPAAEPPEPPIDHTSARPASPDTDVMP